MSEEQEERPPSQAPQSEEQVRADTEKTFEDAELKYGCFIVFNGDFSETSISHSGKINGVPFVSDPQQMPSLITILNNDVVAANITNRLLTELMQGKMTVGGQVVPVLDYLVARMENVKREMIAQSQLKSQIIV